MKKIGIISGIIILSAGLILVALVFSGVFKDKVKVKDLSKYTIVYSYTQTQPVREKAQEFAVSINEKYGTDIKVRSNSEQPAGEFEILIGESAGKESEQYVDSLRTAGYGYTIVNKKIIIAGRNTETTVMAIDAFINDVLNKNDSGDSVFYSEDYNKTETGEYLLSELYINNVSVKDFIIVYPERTASGENLYADSLSSQIAEIAGYSVGVFSENENYDKNKNIIYVGLIHEEGIKARVSDTQYYIGYDGKNITIWSGSEEGILRAVNKLIELFVNADEKNYNFKPDKEYIYDFDGDAMRAMSFNIFCGNMTGERVDRVLDIIEKYMPDTIGVQEATPEWMQIFKERLGTVYKCVGEGRDGGNKGEYSAILYNWHVFDIADKGTKWLSDTPDEVSKYEESSLNRIFTYAVLSRKSDGKKVLAVNTHLDHKSADARKKQVNVLFDFLTENKQYPVILTGDFNAKLESAVYKSVIDGGMSDSMNIAAEKYASPTYTNYGASSRTIDFAFFSEKNFDVLKYRVCNEKINSNFPSDHHPVMVEYKLK